MLAGGTTIPSAGREREGCESNVRFCRDFKMLSDALTPQVTKHDLGCQVRGLVDSRGELEAGMFRGNLISTREHRAVKVKVVVR